MSVPLEAVAAMAMAMSDKHAGAAADYVYWHEHAAAALPALPAGVYVSDGKGKVEPFEALTPDEAKIVRLVACGLKGAPQGTMWDGLIDKLKRIAALSATDTENTDA